MALSLVALGVVYGDIGTSPLYAIRECFHGEYGIAVSHANVLGVLSLVFWSLIIVVSVKYLGFVLRADNGGEGGVMALTALIIPSREKERSRRLILLGMGIFAASILFGDAMITPAISVLSAVEGLRIATPVFAPYVIPITTAILLTLFLVQKHGTGGVGKFFGPITLVWFVVIAVLGLRGIITNPHVLAAFNPWYGLSFFMRNGMHGFIVMGAVFLVVTGAEALYADLGHFGTGPIRRTWYAVVLPCLLCSYFGQGAVLLLDPTHSHHPFYALAPSWAVYPIVILATMATVIASQAVITGAFSLTRQAIQLGYLPRLRIIHTSESEPGQIYAPQVNWLLLLATIVLVVGFQTSSRLAAAYGVAVTATMMATTILFYVVARERWNWSPLLAGIPSLVFLIGDLVFFGANITKLLHGAWFPIAVGGGVYFLMSTWRRGRRLVGQKLYTDNPPLAQFIEESSQAQRVEGWAVYLAGSLDLTPPALLQNFNHNRSIHSHVVILTVVTESVPEVPREEKVNVEELGHSFFKVIARNGFMEEPNVPYSLALAKEKGLEIDMDTVSYILGRERLLPDRKPMMPVWREAVFAFVSHNTAGPAAHFQLPPRQVLEIGSQIEI